ncbi:hypothetical protein [Streptomyces sp. NPDC058308]|uniref:hypothetical protein n=1 Tax=Streptomyces sp. NPDC058308 TaxID=3346440 RepID=UPI0036EA9822
MPSASADMPRRSILRAGAACAATAGFPATALPATALPARVPPSDTGPADTPTRPGGRPGKGRLSENGWPVEEGADRGGAIWTRPVPGSPLSVPLRLGDVSTVLVHVVRRYHYEIDSLRPDEVMGFIPPSRAPRGYATNHSSGTALAIRPGWYPPGARGGLIEHHVAVVRDILAECRGVVAWGGTFQTPDESHFHIAVPPSDPRLRHVARRIHGWADVPGAGAGTRVVGS